MKVFISHASPDRELAWKLAAKLSEAGLDVWNPYEEIAPGDNWAMKVGQALEASDLMILLITPAAAEAESVRREMEYALTAKRFRGRLLSVVIGRQTELPWILSKQAVQRIDLPEQGFGDVVDEVLALAH